MNELVKLLIEKELTISSCESFTVGGFASLIGSVPGVSRVYRGSLVSYQTMIKEKVLNIDHGLVEEKGVVSKEVAYLMCQEGASLFESDICVSFTGNAGPDAMEGKPVGMVFVGVNLCQSIEVYEFSLQGTRDAIKEQAITLAKEILLKKLKSFAS